MSFFRGNLKPPFARKFTINDYFLKYFSIIHNNLTNTNQRKDIESFFILYHSLLMNKKTSKPCTDFGQILALDKSTCFRLLAFSNSLSVSLLSYLQRYLGIILTYLRWWYKIKSKTFYNQNCDYLNNFSQIQEGILFSSKTPS